MLIFMKSALVLLLTCGMVETAHASRPEWRTRADSLRHVLLGGMDPMRAPAATGAYRAQVEATPDATPGERFEALMLDATAWGDRPGLNEAHLESTLATLQALAEGPPADVRKLASLARLRAQRSHDAGRHDLKLVWVLVADSLFRAAGATDDPEYAAVLKYRALTLRGPGRFAEAEEKLVAAATLLERHCGAESDSLWDILAYRASNFLGPGSAARSFALLDRAVAMVERLFGPRSIRLGQAYYNYAGIEEKFGLLDRAVRSLARVEAIAEHHAAAFPEWRLFAIRDARAFYLDMLGRPAEAESLYARTIPLASAHFGDNDSGVLHMLGNRAWMRLERGRFGPAGEDFARMRLIFASNETDPSGPIHLHYLDGSARVALAAGDTAEARRFVVQRRDAERNAPGDADVLAVHRHLLTSWYSWLAGDPAAALAAGLDADRVVRSYLVDHATSLSETDALRLRASMAGGLALALTALRHPWSSSDDVRRAHDAVALSRGLILDAGLARESWLRAAEDTTTGAMLDRLAAIRKARSDAAMSPDRAAIDSTLRQLAIAEREVLAAFGERAPTLMESVGKAQAGLDAILPALRDSESLVSYVRFNAREEESGSGRDRFLKLDRYAALIAAPGGPGHFVDVGPAEAIDSLVLSWREQVEDHSLEPESRARRIRDTGRALRRGVLDPVFAVTGSRARLCVVPDGMLALLPFDLLVSEDGLLLAEGDVEIRTISTERDLLGPAEANTVAARGVLALGGADFDSASPGRSDAPSTLLASAELDRALIAGTGPVPALPLRFDPAPCLGEGVRRFAPLPQSAIEAHEVGELAKRGGVEALVLTGSDASEPAFKRHAPGHAYLHIASHGFWLADSCPAAAGAASSAMLRSGLVLAGANAGTIDPATGEDGILTAEEIGGLDLRGTRAVVLSACESGLGQGVDWEGLIGLRRAFRTAGAEAVVTSLWKVEDRAARQWMRAFYEDLWAGSGDLSQAGRQATRSMIARDRALGREPDPFTCGAFVVTATGPGR